MNVTYYSVKHVKNVFQSLFIVSSFSPFLSSKVGFLTSFNRRVLQVMKVSSVLFSMTDQTKVTEVLIYLSPQFLVGLPAHRKQSTDENQQTAYHRVWGLV